MEWRLLGLSEEMFRVRIQRLFRTFTTGNPLLGMGLVGRAGRSRTCARLFIDDLQPSYHAAIVARLDSLIEVATVEVGGLARDKRGSPRPASSLPFNGDPWNSRARYALGIDQPEVWHAEELHHGQRAGWSGRSSPTFNTVGAFPVSARQNPERVVREWACGIRCGVGLTAWMTSGIVGAPG